MFFISTRFLERAASGPDLDIFAHHMFYSAAPEFIWLSDTLQDNLMFDLRCRWAYPPRLSYLFFNTPTSSVSQLSVS